MSLYRIDIDIAIRSKKTFPGSVPRSREDRVAGEFYSLLSFGYGMKPPAAPGPPVPVPADVELSAEWDRSVNIMAVKKSYTFSEDEGSAALAMEPPLSAEEAVTEALRHAITDGVLAPGQRLAQADLAEQLGVSRIPLRDALRRLEAEALVRIDGRRGARVAELSNADIHEIYEMRIVLEGRCLRLAMSNLSDADAAQLVAVAEEMEEKATNRSEGLGARRAFYGALYEHAERPRMRRVIFQLRDNIARYHLLTNRELSRKAHSDLRSAIPAADDERAAGLLCQHLEKTRDDLLAKREDSI